MYLQKISTKISCAVCAGWSEPQLLTIDLFDIVQSPFKQDYVKLQGQGLDWFSR